MLQYNHPAELASLVDAQSNPSSSLFRHFLTSDQFNNYFAPTPQQQAFVVATLQAAGLRVTQAFPNRTLLDVQGTSAAAEAFFGTEVHTVVQAQYGARFANVKPLTVPATIASFVSSVGLSNLVVARPRPLLKSHVASAAVAQPLGSVQSAQKLCSTGQPENGPLQDSVGHLATGIAKAFDFPVQHGCNGAGRTAAIVIDGPIQQSDINLYMNASGVKQTGTFTNVPVNGGSTVVSGEGSLDVETIIGLAPGANVLAYVIPDLGNGSIEDGFAQAVSDNVADVVNLSIGECETGDLSFAAATEALAVQGASKGITFVGTSGDAGSDNCGTGNKPPIVSSPGGPHFLAVGAIDFTQNSTTGALTSVFATGADGFLSGGGVSTVFPLPSYQKGIKNVIASGRNQPDLSLPGVDVAVFDSKQDPTESGADGTSWAGPEVTALLT